MNPSWAFLICFFLISKAHGTDTLSIGYTYAPPFLINTEATLPGINFWLWEKIAEEHNVQFEYVNKPFSELLTDLEEGTIDICINPLTITADRLDKFQFTQPFYVAYSAIVTKHKSRLRKFLDSLRSIFSLNFLSGFLSLAIIIVIFGYILWRIERKHNPEQFRKGVKGIWDGIYWSTVTMTTVGYGDKTPKSGWGKIIALCWMFVALLFVSSLTASIASNLTLQGMSSQGETIHDFKEKILGL